jgi:hypothetical protein
MAAGAPPAAWLLVVVRGHADLLREVATLFAPHGLVRVVEDRQCSGGLLPRPESDSGDAAASEHGAPRRPPAVTG